MKKLHMIVVASFALFAGAGFVHATTYEMSYFSDGADHFYSPTIYLTGGGTHTFFVNGVPNFSGTFHYSGQKDTGSGYVEVYSHSSSTGVDPSFSTYVSPGNKIKMIIWDASWNVKSVYYWYIYSDTTPPSNPTTFTGSDPINIWTTDNDLYVKWSGASDGGTGLQKYHYEWSTSSSATVDTSDPSAANTTGSGSQNKNGVSDGFWYFHIRYMDNAGNWASSVKTYGPFKVDRTPPAQVTSITGPTGGEHTTDTTPTLRWSAPTENGSGIDQYEVDLEFWTGINWWNTSEVGQMKTESSSAYFTPPELTANGTRYRWCVRAWDKAGNVSSSWSSWNEFYIDNPVGSVRVYIEPVAARTAGAKWKIDSESTWRTSGTTANNIPAGSHYINFLDASPWTPPSAIYITIPDGGAVEKTAIYRSPDLIVTDIWTTPANPASGQQYTISATIKNQGDWIAGPFHVRCNVDGSTISGTGLYIFSLGGGASTNIVLATTTMTGSSDEVEITADQHYTVDEQDETNNSRTKTVAAETQKVATPSVNPASGTYGSPLSVIANCSTDGATIRYTSNGSEPTESSVVWGNSSISLPATLKFKAFKSGWTASDTVTRTYSKTSDPTYTLTVNSGSGGGSYTNGQHVTITANPPPGGQVFDKWTGATTYIGNLNSSFTTVTMPSQNITVTATYKVEDPNHYTLTVANGSGNGSSYTNGQSVTITADSPPSGQVFDKWTGDTAYVANVSAASTTVTMPAQNITVTATYRDDDGSSAVRDINGYAVSVVVSPASSVSSYAVEELLEIGMTPSNISSGGSWTNSTRKLKWGPFLDNQQRTFTYTVSSTGTISGVVSFDGSSIPVSGDTQVTRIHPADLNDDMSIAINEVTGYGSAWKRGESWVRNPNPIEVDYVTRAGYLWKNGEDYSDNSGTPPGCWILAPRPAPSGAVSMAVAAPLAVDSSQQRTVAGQSVSLSVIPADTVSSYAVEEILPTGLTATNMNNSGVWDESKRKVRWGPYFDAEARTFSYEVQGASGVYTLDGVVSYDGVSSEITGETQLTIGGTVDPISVQQRTVAGQSVSLSVIPADTVSSYAVEEILPTGLTATNMNNSGVWDESNRKVRWGPYFDAEVRTFEYEVQGASGVYTLDGFVSYDGVSSAVAGETQLTIGGTVDPVTVTFNAQGGTTPSPASKDVVPGSTYGTLATTSRSGYDFGGWWTGSGGTGFQVTFSTAVSLTSDHTLYAKWVPAGSVYTLIVTGGSGSGTAYTNGQQVTISAYAAPYRKVFAQWVGDTQYVTSTTSATTVVTMPGQAVALTAEYVLSPRWLVYEGRLQLNQVADGRVPGTFALARTAENIVLAVYMSNDQTNGVLAGWSKNGGWAAWLSDVSTGCYPVSEKSDRSGFSAGKDIVSLSFGGADMDSVLLGTSSWAERSDKLSVTLSGRAIGLDGDMEGAITAMRYNQKLSDEMSRAVDMNSAIQTLNRHIANRSKKTWMVVPPRP